MRTWVQANFMLHAVARWRAPDARNSNKGLLMPAADPHVDCPVLRLSFDHGPTRRRRGIRTQGFRAHQPSRVQRQFITASYGNATTVVFRLESSTSRYALLLILRCQAQATP